MTNFEAIVLGVRRWWWFLLVPIVGRAVDYWQGQSREGPELMGRLLGSLVVFLIAVSLTAVRVRRATKPHDSDKD